MTEPETPAEHAPASATHEATIRRAPKLGAFLLIGGALGALVTLILTSLFPVDPNIGFAATYAYLLLYGIPFGLLVGGIVGLVFDRRSKRRTRTVTVEQEHVD